MDVILGGHEINQIAAIKLLFYFYLMVCAFVVYRWRRYGPLVWITAALTALTYGLMVWRHQVLWWGIQGDEVFVGAFLENVAAGNFFSDFFYHVLPPFYPPLYFWLFGGVGFLFGLDGVVSAHVGVFSTLLVLPLAVFYWQQLHWRQFDKKPERWQQVLITLSIFIVADWTAVILKPYEFLSAVLSVLWLICLAYDAYFHRLTFLKIVWYGISGGLLFLTYYFWFLPLGLALLIFKLSVRIKHFYFYSRLMALGAVAFCVASVYLVPLAITYYQLGAENWQPAFFIPEYLDYFNPYLQFSVYGLFCLAGLATMFVLWKRIFVKATASVLIASYVWQAVNLVTLLFWNAPFLPNKPFLFLASTALTITGGYGVSVLFRQKLFAPYRSSAIMVLLVLIALQLPFGTFIDDPAVRVQMLKGKQPLAEEYVQLIDSLKKVPNLESMTVLSSGVPQVYSFVPLNSFVGYNAHFSHPAMSFSERYNFVRVLAAQYSPEAFYETLKTYPGSEIDALLLYKGEGVYPILFWVDDYPAGVKEVQIDIPARLIDSRYFDTVFEDKYFVLYRIKR